MTARVSFFFSFSCSASLHKRNACAAFSSLVFSILYNLKLQNTSKCSFWRYSRKKKMTNKELKDIPGSPIFQNIIITLRMKLRRTPKESIIHKRWQWTEIISQSWERQHFFYTDFLGKFFKLHQTLKPVRKFSALFYTNVVGRNTVFLCNLL